MTSTRPILTAFAVLAASLLAACDDGGGGSGTTRDSAAAGADNERRVVDVAMEDIRFDPSSIEVRQGETITFRFTNLGAIPHDAFVGTTSEQADHEKEMAAAAREGGDEHEHAGHMNAVTVQPGDTQTITHTFDETGELEIGCHQPGHYDAGMKVSITVA